MDGWASLGGLHAAQYRMVELSFLFASRNIFIAELSPPCLPAI
jgi:hypothetical protein